MRRQLSAANNFATCYPEVAATWHPSNRHQPNEYSYGSQSVVRWQCKCGYEWSASIHNRIKTKSCRRCAWRNNAVASADKKTFKLPVDTIKVLLEMRKQGATLNSLAEWVGCTHRTIKEFMGDIDKILALGPAGGDEYVRLQNRRIKDVI